MNHQDAEQAPVQVTDAEQEPEVSSSISVGDRTLGGKIENDAFCLLDGFVVREKEELVRVRVPVTRLPATFGRNHETDDTAFFGIGSFKSFSRQHFRIDFWCGKRGRLAHIKAGSETFDLDESLEWNSLLNPNAVDMTKPFYTVTCLGKNGIQVQASSVANGKAMALKDGDAIRASSLFVYFFLPPQKFYSKPKPSKRTAENNDEDASSTTKKRKGFTSIQAEIDTLSTEELLRQMTQAIETDTWERRHQLIGSKLSDRAVMVAAQTPELKEKAAQAEGALSRGEIMEWIAASDQFGEWAQQMLTKLEAKSYQSSITKAMIKVGFTRTASCGRYIKWMMPKDDEDASPDQAASLEAGPKSSGEGPDDSSSIARSMDEGTDPKAADSRHKLPAEFANEKAASALEGSSDTASPASQK